MRKRNQIVDFFSFSTSLAIFLYRSPPLLYPGDTTFRVLLVSIRIAFQFLDRMFWGWVDRKYTKYMYSHIFIKLPEKSMRRMYFLSPSTSPFLVDWTICIIPFLPSLAEWHDWLYFISLSIYCSCKTPTHSMNDNSG